MGSIEDTPYCVNIYGMICATAKRPLTNTWNVKECESQLGVLIHVTIPNGLGQPYSVGAAGSISFRITTFGPITHLFPSYKLMTRID